MFKVKIKV